MNLQRGTKWQLRFPPIKHLVKAKYDTTPETVEAIIVQAKGDPISIKIKLPAYSNYKFIKEIPLNLFYSCVFQDSLPTQYDTPTFRSILGLFAQHQNVPGMLCWFIVLWFHNLSVFVLFPVLTPLIIIFDIPHDIENAPVQTPVTSPIITPPSIIHDNPPTISDSDDTLLLRPKKKQRVAPKEEERPVRRRGRRPKNPCPVARFQLVAGTLTLDDENNVIAPVKTRSGEGTAIVKNISHTAQCAIQESPLVPPEVKLATQSIPVNTASDVNSIVILDPPPTMRRNIPIPIHPPGSSTGIESGIPVAPNVEQALSLEDIPLTQLNLPKMYNEARSVYAQHGYELVPETSNLSFFLDHPARLLIVFFPPQIIFSIIEHSNNYHQRYHKTPMAPITIIDFLKYILVLLETKVSGYETTTVAFRGKKDLMALSKYRYTTMTSALQLTEDLILNRRQAGEHYDSEKVVTDSIIKTGQSFAEWTMQVVEKFTIGVIDEGRIPYKQKLPLTNDSNPISNFSLKKPSKVALQLHSLHDGRTLLLLNFLPTVSNFAGKYNQPRPFGDRTLASTTVVNYLIAPIPQGDELHQIMFIMDGYYGSAQTAKIITGQKHHIIANVNRNSSELPQSTLLGLPCGYDEYLRIAVHLVDGGRIYKLQLTRSGSKHPNTTLSSLFSDKVIGRFSVRRTKDGLDTIVHLIPTQALYKMTSNSADIFNQRVVQAGVASLQKTRIFKTRLIHYLITMMLVQVNLCYNYLEKTHGPGKAPRKFFGFWDRLAWSLRYLLYVEHHYTLGVQFQVDQVELKSQILSGDLVKYCNPPGKGTNYRPTQRCVYVKGGMERHKGANDQCLACLARLPIGYFAYACPPCRDQKHSEYHLVLAPWPNDVENVSRILDERRASDNGRPRKKRKR